MGLPDIVPKIIAILAFCAQVLSGASFFFMYDCVDHRNNRIISGHEPKHYWANYNWYQNYSLFCFGLMSLILAICELGLLFAPGPFEFVNSPVLRAVIYVLKGIACMGVAADLGLASGVIEIAVGGIMLIIGILQMSGSK